MEEETQNSTPNLDSIELENQDRPLRVESSLRPHSPIPESSLADPNTTDVTIISAPGNEDAPSKSEECCEKDSSTLQELKNQARELQDEIFKSLNHNLALKKRFLLAKSVLKRDRRVGCLEELVREREEEGWCGSKDVVAALKKKLHSLKNQVREKREESEVKSKEGCSIIPFECPLPEDERIQGLVCMEREYMIHNVRREEHQWVEDRDRLDRKLEFFVERNKRLEAEALSIRSDLCMEPEALEVVSVARFLGVQRRMDLCLEKKFKLKNSLLAAEASVRANGAEIERLRTDIGRQEALLAESETALRMAEREGGGEEDHESLVEELRIERQATSRMFREGLGELLATCGALLERAESSEVSKKNAESLLTIDDVESQLVSEIRRRRNSGKGDAGVPKLIKLHCPEDPLQALTGESSSCPPPSEEHQREQRIEERTELMQREEKVEEANLEPPATSPSTRKPVQCQKKVGEEANLESCLPETEKECRDAMKDLLSNMIGDFELQSISSNAQPLGDEEAHLVKSLEEELLELSSSFAKRKRALRKQHWRLQAVFDRLKYEANQLLDARGQLSKESATVRVLSNRLKRMAKEVDSSTRGVAETFRFGDASEVEDSKTLLQVLRSENACVKRLIRAACASVDEDVDKFLQLSAIKIFL